MCFCQSFSIFHQLGGMRLTFGRAPKQLDAEPTAFPTRAMEVKLNEIEKLIADWYVTTYWMSFSSE
jgi:hypothetical protein